MNESTVFVVDDDRAVRESLQWVLQSAGYRVESYDSAEAFLAVYRPGKVACLVLDVAMPGMTGLELQRQLAAIENDFPIIFISAHGSVPAAVSAMRAGAVDFLMKPFNNHALLERIAQALDQSRQRLMARAQQTAVNSRLAALTAREREVLAEVVAGLANKQIAAKLDISIKTVETHRANIMSKTGADSVAELVRLALVAHTLPADG